MSGRVWVITGASSGFGLAIASYALAQGEKVVVTVRSPSKFPETLKEAGARPVYLDMLSSDDVIQKAAEDAIQVYGHADVLVNNAGVSATGLGPLEERSITDIRETFEVNVFSLLIFTKPFIAHFRSRRAGHILNVSSFYSIWSPPGSDIYSATKSALNIFTHNLESELRLFGVKVHLLLPGCFYDTNIWPTEDVPPVHAIGPYTDLETQGIDIVRFQRTRSAEKKQAGDTKKLAVRVYEIVAGVGLAGGVIRDAQRPVRVWIPLGSDAGEECKGKLSEMLECIDNLEPVWRSTDISDEHAAGLFSKFGGGE